MYKANRKGTAKGKSGKFYRWVVGQTIDVSKDELLGAYGLEWMAQTKKDIMKALDDKGIEYDGRSKKDDLLKLLE